MSVAVYKYVTFGPYGEVFVETVLVPIYDVSGRTAPDYSIDASSNGPAPSAAREE